LAFATEIGKDVFKEGKSRRERNAEKKKNGIIFNRENQMDLDKQRINT
jgi:hypothetical protein